MANLSITRLSSKGQIVIPSEMRYGLKEGEELLVMREGDRIIIKEAGKITKQMREDLEFAKRTEEAWQQIERGEGTSMPADKFLKELEKW